MRAGPQLSFFYPSWRKRQPYGSAMGLQAAPLRSPFKVVADAFLLNLALSSRTCSAIAFYTFRI